MVVGVDVLEALRVAVVCREVVRSCALGVGLVGSVSSRLTALSTALVLSRGAGSGFASVGFSVTWVSSSLVGFWPSALLRPVEPRKVLVSIVVADMPFVLVGLFDADDCARWRDSGRANCAEFWRARDEDGRCGALALGIGLLRWGSFDSVDGRTTGDEARGGGPVAEVLVLFLYQVSSEKTL